MSWINNEKAELNWPNAQGYDMLTYYDWNGSAWEPSEREIDVVWHDYNKDLRLSSKYQGYQTGAWTDYGRVTTVYGQNNSFDLVYEELDSTGWTNNYRDMVTMDAQEHIIAEQQSNWAGAWNTYSDRIYLYTYGVQGNTEQIITQSLNDSTSIYENYEKEVFSSFFVNTEDAIGLKQTVAAFPNPCTTQLNFRFKEVQAGGVQVILYDIKGTKRLEMISPITATEVEVPISDQLEAGTYTYRILTNAGQATGKVVVQR